MPSERQHKSARTASIRSGFRRFAVVALALGVLTLAGNSAFALPWTGEVRVSTYDGPGGSGSPVGSTTVHGSGTGTMEWCSNQPYEAAQAPAIWGGSIKIEVLGASACNTAKLPAGTYDVTLIDKAFVNSDLSTSSSGNPTYSHSEAVLDCHPMLIARGGTAWWPGALTVNSTGQGGATINFFFNWNALHEAGAVCITHQDTWNGNMIPLWQTHL